MQVPAVVPGGDLRRRPTAADAGGDEERGQLPRAQQALCRGDAVVRAEAADDAPRLVRFVRRERAGGRAFWTKPVGKSKQVLRTRVQSGAISEGSWGPMKWSTEPQARGEVRGPPPA
eukprot:gene5416-biopygen1946